MIARLDSSLLAASALLVACGSASGTIGAILGQRTDGRLFIRQAPEDLAARKEGLEPGDEILLIDGIDVRTLDPERVHALLSGDVGTSVRLTLIRGDEVIRVNLKRTEARPHRVPSTP